MVMYAISHKTDRATCAPLFEICLKAAADLFDGASGNLSGRLSLYCQAGWSIKGNACHQTF
jgi:hypothetical protein